MSGKRGYESSYLDGKGQKAYWNQIRAARRKEHKRKSEAGQPLTDESREYIKRVLAKRKEKKTPGASR